MRSFIEKLLIMPHQLQKKMVMILMNIAMWSIKWKMRQKKCCFFYMNLFARSHKQFGISWLEKSTHKRWPFWGANERWRIFIFHNMCRYVFYFRYWNLPPCCSLGFSPSQKLLSIAVITDAEKIIFLFKFFLRDKITFFLVENMQTSGYEFRKMTLIDFVFLIIHKKCRQKKIQKYHQTFFWQKNSPFFCFSDPFRSFLLFFCITRKNCEYIFWYISKKKCVQWVLIHNFLTPPYMCVCTSRIIVIKFFLFITLCLYALKGSHCKTYFIHFFREFFLCFSRIIKIKKRITKKNLSRK